MIFTGIEGLRDPFILLENGVYYLYGTDVNGQDWDNTKWGCYVNDSGSLSGQWKKIEEPIYVRPQHAQKQFWSAEVHKYKGAYYMFATYYSSKTNRRGTAILKADSPTGPFVEISNGHATPADWDCIDATLYVDNAGQPWLVFVHEWVCTDDRNGRMDVAKLSDDLTHIISQPVEIFQADSPAWAVANVTDGPFVHTTKTGKLLMLWTNEGPGGYTMGIAYGVDNRIDGRWEQDPTPIFTKGTVDHHPGGCGMIFTDTDGQQYMTVHSPNIPCDECRERVLIIPIEEANDTIVLKTK